MGYGDLHIKFYFVILGNAMIRKIDIGDVQLDNNTVRESVMLVERAITEQGFVAMEEVTLKTLLLAEENDKVSEGLKMLDHTVIADNEILVAAKQGNMQRKYEIEDHTFFFELMKRLERNGKRVFLLGESKEKIAERVPFFLSRYPKLQIAGTGAIEDCAGNDEALVNQINSLSPDVIICLLPAPFQEVFLLEHKGKISANLWYGMGEINPSEEKTSLFERLRKRRQKKELEKVIWAN